MAKYTLHGNPEGMNVDRKASLEVIQPDWAAPPNIRALSTLRQGGVSSGPYGSLNLGNSSGDNLEHIERNRQILAEETSMPVRPAWLNQVHGTVCVDASITADPVAADASYCSSVGSVCAILTADCLPVLLCNRAGTEIAAAHAGWRGLRAGVLESTLNWFGVQRTDIIAWLGPCIGAQRYEIGPEVYDAFMGNSEADAQHFESNRPGHWLANLAGLASARLRRAGVSQISGGDWCTASDAQRFFSYRRDGTTGRMATCIWMQ
jgi:hypothetical protein